MAQRYAEDRAVIPLSLSGALVRRLNQLALERNTTRSALIRDAVTATYFAHREGQPEDAAAASKGAHNDT